jgi:dipeptidyl aminopeptidase/acylaminoacyl peptidase
VAQRRRAGYESDKFRLVAYDRAKRRLIKDLLPKFDNWVDEFAWGPDSQRVYFASSLEGTSPIYLAGLDGSVQTFYRLGTLADLHPLPDNQTVLCAWSGVERPSEIISLSTATSSQREQRRLEADAQHDANVLHSTGPITILHFKQVTNLNGRLLAKLDLSDMEDFWFTAQDGTKVQGFLIRPPGFDPSKEISGQIPDSRRPAGRVGRLVELPLERRALRRERLRRGHDQSARVDGLRAGLCRRRKRRLGRQAVSLT